MVLFSSVALLSLETIPQMARAVVAAGNSSQTSVGPSSANLNLITGAVVTFILLLVGLAAGILLMGRYPNQERNHGASLTDSNRTDDDKMSEKGGSKRNFLKLILTLGGIATVGSFASVLKVLEYVPAPGQGASTVPLAWPVVKLANVSTLDPSKPLRFNYPLVDTPSVLVKCGQKADNGVGPDSDIVAFSDVCQHLGCFYFVLAPGSSPPCNPSYQAATPQGYCCCHGGQYDFVHGAQVIGGPPPRAVPQVVLRYDTSTGDVFAVGMGPPSIFGHGPPGTTDPAKLLRYDLTGGAVVTDATVFSGTK